MSKEMILKAKCIATLKVWLDENPHMPEISDEILEMFLNCRSYDMELTKTTIEAFLEMSTNTPELFSSLDVLQPEFSQAMSVLQIAVLPRRDSNGRIVIIYRLTDEDPSEMHLIHIVKYISISSYLTAYQNRDAPGYILIFDTSSVKFGHISRFSVSILRKYLAFTQEATPIDIKRIHMINTSSLTYMIMNLMKPFLRKTLSEKIEFHTSTLNKFFDEIPKDILPKDYGGGEKFMEELTRQHQENVKKNRDLILQREKLRIDETKRPTASK